MSNKLKFLLELSPFSFWLYKSLANDVSKPVFDFLTELAISFIVLMPTP